MLLLRYLLPLLLAVPLFGGCDAPVAAVPVASPAAVAEPDIEGPVEWTMAVGGDIMLNGISPDSNPLGAVEGIFAEADISFANLEIPLTDALTRTWLKSDEDVRARRQWVLKADPRHIESLRMFTIVSLGNNHTMDYGPNGLEQTTSLLADAGIGYAGAGTNLAEAEAPAIAEVRGLRIGMISYLAFVTTGARAKCWPATAATAGIAGLELGGVVNDRSREKIRSTVQAAKEECDFLIVSLHWGVERQTEPNAYQKEVGRTFIDEGADLVLGHHPHVLQPVEIYNGKPIFYSLGNLISATPARTAVFSLRFLGTRFVSYEEIPATISSGRIRPVTGPN